MPEFRSLPWTICWCTPHRHHLGAVGADEGAADELRLGGGEEGGEGADLPRLAEPAPGERLAGGGDLGIGGVGPLAGRVDPAGGDAVDGNVVRRQLVGGGTGQVDGGRLGRVIGSGAREGLLGVDGTDDDQAAAVTL